MPKRGNGEGTIEKLPSGKFRAKKSKMIAGELVTSSKTFPRRTEAVAWLNSQDSPAKADTVGEWLDTWLSLVKPDVSPKTHHHNRYPVEKKIKPHLGEVKLRDLTAIAISRWLAKLAEEGVSNSERHRAGRVLRQALRVAVVHQVIPKSPMQGVKLPQPNHPEKRALTAEELARFIEVADTRGVGYQFRVWADAGLRPGEYLALNWEDFDIEAGTVSVKFNLESLTNKLAKLKTKKSRRTIKLSESTIEAVRNAKPITGGLFVPSSHRTHYWQKNYMRIFKPVAEAAGVPWVTPYTLRHTMATLLIRAGVPLKVVSERMGHENVTTTLRTYAHVMEGDQERAAVAMGSLLPPVHHALSTVVLVDAESAENPSTPGGT